jgi:hypothetical protein
MDRTAHRTVSYRIYGVKNTVKTVLTVPYRITVHRTVHRTASALIINIIAAGTGLRPGYLNYTPEFLHHIF